MASPTPKRSQQDSFARYPPRPPVTGPPDLVDPRFLVKAFAGVVAAAVVLAYLSVCLLVYIGGWHRLLHPSAQVWMPKDTRTDLSPPERLLIEPVRFGKLTGWWLPSDSASRPTALYLHDGDGALAFSGSLGLLHAADVNILAIDYRGFGQSEGPHPTETRMQEDAAVALDYLLYTRHIPAAKIVPYGVGLGGVLAADLAATHPELPAVIIDQPRPDAYYQAVDAQQSRLLPMHLLVRDRFDIAAALAGVRQAKLLIANSPQQPDASQAERNGTLFRGVASPKMTVTFDQPMSIDSAIQSLRRFLDEYVRSN